MMLCLFDCHEVHRFTFNEECQIGQIESNEVIKDVKIPQNAVATWVAEGKVAVINQCGYSERQILDEQTKEVSSSSHGRLSQWSNDQNKLFNNIGPVVDFL